MELLPASQGTERSFHWSRQRWQRLTLRESLVTEVPLGSTAPLPFPLCLLPIPILPPCSPAVQAQMCCQGSGGEQQKALTAKALLQLPHPTA